MKRMVPVPNYRKEAIAFILSYDTSPLGDKSCFDWDNYLVFCYDDFAFGLLYFQSDEDYDAGIYDKSFSLSSYPRSALTWSYITKLLVNRIKELADRVPKLKI